MAAEENRLDRPRIGILLGSLEAGGAQRMGLELARGLLRAGYEVRLICLDRDRAMALSGSKAEQYALEQRLIVLGDGRTSASTVAKALAFPRLHRRLELLIAQARLHLVISFMERANLVNLLGRRSVLRILSVRKHIGEGLRDNPPLKRWLVRSGYRFLLHRAHAVTFNARSSATDFVRHFPVKSDTVYVIPNSVDPAIRTLADTRLTILDRCPFGPATLVTAGRMVYQKGHMPLLRAFARVVEHMPVAQLVVLGDGPMRQSLASAAQTLRIADSVTFAGFQANPYPWIAAGTAFALPSRYEGFPNALLEAMLLSRAVVAADCPSGPRELLSPNSAEGSVASGIEFAPYGLLVPTMPDLDLPLSASLTASEGALAQAIILLLDDARLRARYAAQAARRAGNYHPSAVLQKWLSLIDLCLDLPGL